MAIKVLPPHLSASPEVAPAVRARGEDDLAALASAHLRALRRGARGRDRVPGHGVPGGRDAGGPAGEGRAAARADAALRDRDRRRAGQGAPAGDRAPGPEARQRDADEVGREAPRLRPGQGDGAGRRRSRQPDRAADAARGPDAGRDDPRDVPVHGARAARGQGGRRADGHLRVRLRALRDGDGTEGVLRREPGVAHLGDHVERAGADLLGPADVAAGARPRREDLPRQGPRGPLAERGRREARAQVDRRRLGRRHRGARRRRRTRRGARGWPGPWRRGLLAGAVALRCSRGPPPPASAPLRSTLPSPPGLGPWTRDLAVSPDGRRLLFFAEVGDGRRSTLGSVAGHFAVRPLEGTESRATRSGLPTAARSRFFQAGKLERIDADGGAIQTICEEGGSGFGGSWNANGEIVFCGDLRSAAHAGSGRRRNSEARDRSRREARRRGPPVSLVSAGRTALYRSPRAMSTPASHPSPSAISTRVPRPDASSFRPIRARSGDRRAICSSPAKGRSSRSDSTPGARPRRATPSL